MKDVRKMTISVIVPVYNAASTIDKCVKSLIIQSYPKIEIILIEDHSTDESYSLISKKFGNEKRIRIYRTSQNSGPSKARNLGLDVAYGDWVMFVDADDYVDKNMIERCVSIGKKGYAPNHNISK